MVVRHSILGVENGSDYMFRGSKGLEQHRDRFYGLYRGYVYDNKDPLGMGRIKLTCPSVFGVDNVSGKPIVSDWAFPKFNIAGNGWGFNVVPPVLNPDGTPVLVWVEFEMGDRSKPVYCGCPVAKQGLHKDTLGNEGRTLLLSSPSGHKIVLSDNGNEINMVSVGNINITASGEINIQAGGNVNVSGANINLNS